jgi:hypothetical protein
MWSVATPLFYLRAAAAPGRLRRFLDRLHKFNKNCGKFLCNLTKCNFLKLFSRKALTNASIFGIIYLQGKESSIGYGCVHIR